MKILLAHNYYQLRGGEDDFVDMLHTLLVKKGHKVYLYSKKSSELVSFGNQVMSSIQLLTSVNNEIDKIISTFHPDICHIHNIFPGINFSIINTCKKRGIPIVQTVHDYRYLCLNGTFYRDKNVCRLCIDRNRLFGIKYKCYHSSLLASVFLLLSLSTNLNTIKKIDKFIFPNSYSKDLFNRYLHIEENKSIIISHFIPKMFVEKLVKKEHYFMYLGRLSPEKGIIELLNLFKKEKKINLLIIGTGPLAKYISSLRYTNVQYLGYVSTKKKYNLLRKALFSIIPSRVEEQGPLTLLESFMCGTPIIAPNLSSIAEKVRKKCGFLYNPNVHDSFLSVLIKANTLAKEEYEIMRTSVLNEYKKHYSENIYYKRLISLYEAVSQ